MKKIKPGILLSGQIARERKVGERKIDKANNVSIVPSGSYVDFISYTFKF